MKRFIINLLTITGFVMIVGIPYAVYSGSFFYFVIGCLGYAVMMKGLFMGMDNVKRS